jgi:hypothetical protein
VADDLQKAATTESGPVGKLAEKDDRNKPVSGKSSPAAAMRTPRGGGRTGVRAVSVKAARPTARPKTPRSPEPASAKVEETSSDHRRNPFD